MTVPSRARIAARARPLAAPLAAAALLAGCGSSSRTLSTASRPAARAPATTTNPAAAGGMAGMRMGTTHAAGGTTRGGAGASAAAARAEAAAAPDGIKPIPTQRLLSADWQEMRITAQAMTPVPFVIFDGTSERKVGVPRRTSFHLMVMLDDARTGYPIPYANVWATIRRAGKVVFDERQWPMLSEYMGPHYGNNVTLPGPGRYTLSLLVSPPVAARHMEYAHVWTSPHRVSEAFTWSGA